MIELNYRDTRPIYEQIMDSLKKMIISGALSENEKLPSVRVLATQLSINPNTIQRAINELENEGFVFSVPGKGSFVCPNVRRDTEKIEKLKATLSETVNELRFLGVSDDEIAECIGEKK